MRVGLVGGVGSGKSSLAQWMALRDSAIRVFNADAAGHRALRRSDVRSALQATFGASVIDASGEVNRGALARLVFAPGPTGAERRTALEAIVHPWIQAEYEAAMEAATANPDVRAVLLDAAVLLEAGWQDQCDAIVFVDAPLDVRRARVAERAWPADELQRRDASQWPVEKKRSAADFVVDNRATLDIAGRQLYEYIDRVLRSRT